MCCLKFPCLKENLAVKLSVVCVCVCVCRKNKQPISSHHSDLEEFLRKVIFTLFDSQFCVVPDSFKSS